MKINKLKIKKSKLATFESSKIHRVADKLYYALLVFSVIISVFFMYLTYITYNAAKGTKYMVYTYIIGSPIAISIFLIGFLLYLGKKKFFRELTRK